MQFFGYRYVSLHLVERKNMKALVICTIGTPQNADRKEVKKYLSKFLSDKYVVSLPQPFRSLLVQGIIIPHCIKNSQARYQRLSDMYGGAMPLRIHLEELQQTLSNTIPNDWRVYSYMQHSEESSALVQKMQQDAPFEEIVVLPLFPHKTFSSYISVAERTRQLLHNAFPHSSLRLIKPYFEHPQYIQLLRNVLHPYIKEEVDMYVASFHSIPVRHQERGLQQGFDYRSQCQTTARMLFEALPQKAMRSILFQSPIKPHSWLTPTIEEEMTKWVEQGIRRVVIITPGFPIDCLETVHDLGRELNSQFLTLGGISLQLIPCLNGSLEAAQMLFSLVQEG